MPIVGIRRKAREIQLIEVDGTLPGKFSVALRPLREVGLILPDKVRLRCGNHRSAAARRLNRARIGIRPEQNLPRIGFDFILIERTGFHTRHKERKNTAVSHAPQLMDSAVPVVEVADHRDAHRIRRKDRKADARNTAHLLLVRAEEGMRRRALACLEFAEFHFRQFRHKAVRILCDCLAAVCLRENELIAQTFLLPRNQTGKKAALIG